MNEQFDFYSLVGNETTNDSLIDLWNKCIGHNGRRNIASGSAVTGIDLNMTLCTQPSC